MRRALATSAAEPHPDLLWRRLEASASLPTQSQAFTAALGATLLSGGRIRLFSAQAADGVAAILPLCRSRGFLARWRLMGAREIFEPHDVLCERPDAVQALAEAIVADGRPIAFERLPAASPLIPALRAAGRGKGLMVVRPGVGCPTIRLDGSWTDPESRFNSGRRSDFRRAARRAAELGEVRFEMHAPSPHVFEALFDEAAAVEQSGWKRQAGTAIASDAAKADFFRSFFRAASEEGTFRIAFMRIDGKAVAMQMAIESLGRYWLFKIGYDEAVARCSPGSLLMLNSLGYAASRGLRSYELLGQAEGWIADFWTRDSRDCVRLRTYPFNLRGAAALAADALHWAWVRARRALRVRS